MRKVVLVGMLLLATAVWGWTFVVVKDAVDEKNCSVTLCGSRDIAASCGR